MYLISHFTLSVNGDWGGLNGKFSVSVSPRDTQRVQKKETSMAFVGLCYATITILILSIGDKNIMSHVIGSPPLA